MPPRMASPPAVSAPTTGFIAQWDPSVSSSITSSSGAVSQLNDLSGNTHHLVQATAGKKPTTASRTINSLNALDYVAASNQYLAVSFAQACPVTIIMVVKSDLTGVANAQVCGNAPDGASTSPTIYQETGNWAYFDGADQRSATAVDTSAHVLSVIFDATAGQMWQDNVSLKTGSPNTNALAGIALGAQGGGGSNAHDGLIGEVFVYASALSTGDRNTTETYLKAKWGTP